MDLDAFINRWSAAPLSERAHAQSFFIQLCAVLSVPAPNEDRVDPAGYTFERSLPGRNPADPGQIDCYKRGCFVMEAKQSDGRLRGRAWKEARLVGGGQPRRASDDRIERTMREAKQQAEDYARRLDEWPPFLFIIDVGRSIELWSDFSRQGKVYVPFCIDGRHRLTLDDLTRLEVRQTLTKVWLDPTSLDPQRASIAVTRDVAVLLAGVFKSIVARHADGDAVHAGAWATKALVFVSQCIFAMFADSVGCIRDHAFRRLLEDCRGEVDTMHLAVIDVCRAMDRGGYSPTIRQTLKPFGGGLFPIEYQVPITEAELSILSEAARWDWSDVEPTVFGALLEQALQPADRAASGVHFTPRPYVETLVNATVIEPLRADWRRVEKEALKLRARGDGRTALRVVRDFHRSLRKVRVLDPACGTGNFLYVALRMMKTLEGEVLSLAEELGARVEGDKRGLVSADQFVGLECNPIAAGIARLMMRIGDLQWTLRSGASEHGDEACAVIHTADALLSFQGMVRPGGARKVDARQTCWPDADFIVGNPPFMGAKDQRRELGGAYVDALWATRHASFRSADLVTCWWDRAAEILKKPGSRLRRFGFITTRSITQSFSRRVVEHHLNAVPPIRIAFAIPDHPWDGGGDSASVRVAMSVVERGAANGEGRLLTLATGEAATVMSGGLAFTETRGVIGADFTVGACVSAARPLKANARLASRGVQPMGPGFIVNAETAKRLAQCNAAGVESPFRAYRNGRDLTDRSRDVQIIDLFDHDERTVRRRWPGVYQHLLETVKPDRERNGRASYRRRWWIFGEPRPELRAALAGLERYIVTVETGKHRWFTFLSGKVLADNRLVCVASDDPCVLGVLSSRVHQVWALAAGGRLEDRPIYAKGACFDCFPFPELDDTARSEIGRLALELDELRRNVLTKVPALTMTALYNARDRMDGAVVSGDDHVRTVGCVKVIDKVHREIDAHVLAAYGWPTSLDDDEIVNRLILLNLDRSVEERRGEVRWIRPEFQNRSRTGEALDPSPPPSRRATGQGRRKRLLGAESLDQGVADGGLGEGLLDDGMAPPIAG